MKQGNTKVLCPICMKNNECAMQNNEINRSKQSCWCMTVEVSKAALAQVPDDKKGKSCICRSCLQKFQR